MENKNIYVGHRYVPKIIGEHDKTQSYEGLSIVTHEGTSYTSKKRVPVGVDISNEEYWVVTGNYNAQVEHYRDEVKNMGKYVDSEIIQVQDRLDEKITDISVNSNLFNNLNECLAFAQENNKYKVILSGGENVVNGDLSIFSNLTIEGDGKSQIVLTSPQTLIGIDNVRFVNVEITTNITHSGTMLKIETCNNWKFDNCVIDGKGFDGELLIESGFGHGVGVVNSSNINFNNCEIKNFRVGEGISFDESNRCSVTHCNIHHTGRAGVNVWKNNVGCEIIGNTFTKNVINFTVNDGALDMYGSNNKNTLLEGNIISDYGSETNDACGIRIKGSVNTICRNNNIKAGLYSYAMVNIQERDGIFNDGVLFEGNYLYIDDNGKSGYGVMVMDGNNITINNNQIVSGVNTSSESAIRFLGSSKNVNIQNNIIKSAVEDSHYVGGGVQLYHTANIQNVSIVNAIVSGNTIITEGKGFTSYNSFSLLVFNNNIESEHDSINLEFLTNGYFMNNIVKKPSNSVIEYNNTNFTVSDNLLLSL